MVNNIDMNEEPAELQRAHEPGESASDLMGRYMASHDTRAAGPRLPSQCSWAPLSTPPWTWWASRALRTGTRAALFRYRSRRAFLEIVTNPAFNGKHHFKTAALDKTIAYPIETSLYLGDPRPCLALFSWPLLH